MPLDTAAVTLADHLLEQEFVEVLAHHDADGIAAASILCHAMFRRGGRFRLRIRPSITTEDVPRECSVLLCDFGSALSDLPGDVMVVDHHVPHFEGDYHVNPRLAGIDGDRDLSAAGTAYLIAQHMGDNRDLAGLVLLGILGDRQDLEGPNRDIINEGVATGSSHPGAASASPGGGSSSSLRSLSIPTSRDSPAPPTPPGHWPPRSPMKTTSIMDPSSPGSSLRSPPKHRSLQSTGPGTPHTASAEKSSTRPQTSPLSSTPVARLDREISAHHSVSARRTLCRKPGRLRPVTGRRSSPASVGPVAGMSGSPSLRWMMDR